METINEILHFSNKLDLVGYSEDSDCEKFNCNKKVFRREFQDENSDKIINKLIIFDNLYISFITQDFNIVLISTNNIRNDIFLLIKEKLKYK